MHNLLALERALDLCLLRHKKDLDLYRSRVVQLKRKLEDDLGTKQLNSYLCIVVHAMVSCD